MAGRSAARALGQMPPGAPRDATEQFADWHRVLRAVRAVLYGRG
ncbi:hypothetical protein [Streptomyces sp. NPDC007206]